MDTIKNDDIQGMVGHWLATPVAGYLGSDYGADLKPLLHRPQATGVADGVIQKMIDDILILNGLPNGSVNIYSIQTGLDRLDLAIEVAGQTITIPRA